MPEDVHEPTSTEHFQAFLEAADRVALEILLSDGINPLADHRDRDDWDGALLNELMPFCGSYTKTDVDDCITYEEADVRIAASRMVGIALGMRLSGRLGGAR